jgi:SAM-dependent methyltransferase
LPVDPLARDLLLVAGFTVLTLAMRRCLRQATWPTSQVVDMAAGLPFPNASFDAVMANVSLHMFPDSVTRAVFDDVRRLLRPQGLFLFHVNAHDDRPLRERWRAVVREIEPDYVLEQGGQTVRFSEAYLADLLSGWSVVSSEHVEIPDRATQEPFKRVWRAAARAADGG